MRKLRDYDSHESYLGHQASYKTERNKQEFAQRMAPLDKIFWRRRFRRFAPFIGGRIICLGARLGTEVKVLRELGHPQAFGIDIGGYERAEGVEYGDFMNMTYPDATFDFSYSNCLDHTADPIAFFREVARVMKPGAYTLFDILGRPPSGPFPGYDIWQPESLAEIHGWIRDLGHYIVATQRLYQPWDGQSVLVKWYEPPTVGDRMKALVAHGRYVAGGLGRYG